MTLSALRRGNVEILLLVHFVACLRLPPYADYMRLPRPPLQSDHFTWYACFTQDLWEAHVKASTASSWSPSPYTRQEVDLLVGSGLRRQGWGKTME